MFVAGLPDHDLRACYCNGAIAIVPKHPAVQGGLQRQIARSDYSGEPNRIRTCDPLIKSQLLYQLSYGPITGRLIRFAPPEGQAEKRLSGENFHAGLYASHEQHAPHWLGFHENAWARQ